MAGLALKLLGGFELVVDGLPVTIAKKKARALLAYLAMNAGQQHSREKIAGLLWGNRGEEQARASLRQTLTSLRRALPPGKSEGLVVDGEAFSLDADLVDVDVVRFLAAVSEESPSALQKAVEIYTGELLDGFYINEPEFQDWLDLERHRLCRMVSAALLKLLHFQERTGALSDAVDTANRLLELDSLQENVHRSLMRLHVAQGRQSLALEQFEICRTLLRDELELDPAEETTALYHDIRERRELESGKDISGRPDIERKLAAILAADVAGYSRLMGVDEEGTLRRLRDHRDVIDALVAAHNGRVFGGAGDSVIADFSSPVSALRCALEIQADLDGREADIDEEKRMRFRIGINLGDVLIDGDNLMGDGVNVAARLETLAPPGGVYVSESISEQVGNRLDVKLVDLGKHRVKNIQQPVRVFRVPLESEVPLSSPFRGLNPFDFEHKALFFGRSRAISETMERLGRQASDGCAFLMIYGMSGAGKSSLLRAGLIPAIVEPGAVPGIDNWLWCVMRPSQSESPVASLVNEMCGGTVLPDLGVGSSRRELTELFSDTPERALGQIRRALGRGGPTSSTGRLLIAVDQMEELFAFEPEQRYAFVRALAVLARSGSVWVVSTLRADFFHMCSDIPGFSELKDGFGSYELLPPTAPEISKIVREPAASIGIRYEEHPDQGRLEDVLQQAAMRDAASLPLLEFLLDGLFEAGKMRRLMTFADYRALGGLEGAIAQRADEITGALPSEVQDALPAVLWALTTFRLGDETVGGRTATFADIATTPQQSALIEALINARLLVSNEDQAGKTVVRLAHESLLSHWPRAREIVTENRTYLETRSRLQSDADRWRSEDRNPELLLPPGMRLAEAQDLIKRRRADLDQNVTEYADASIEAEELRQRSLLEAERRQLENEAEQQRLLAVQEREAAELARVRERAASRLAGRTRFAAAVTIVLAAAAAFGAVIGFTGQQEATRQALIAEEQARQARGAEKESELQALSAVSARNDALQNQSLYLTNLSRQQTTAGDAMTGLLLALEALPSKENPDRPYTVQAEAALYTALSSLREVAILSGHEGAVTDIHFSSDGRRLVTGSRDGTARIWDYGSKGASEIVLSGHAAGVQAVDISRDGSRAVTASRDKTVILWDAQSGQLISRLSAHRGDVMHAAFSPDGTAFLTTSRDRTGRIWDASDGREIATLDGHRGPIPYATFNPAGTVVATVSWDRSVRLWDTTTGKPLVTLVGHEDRVNHAIFDRSGQRLITAARDGSVIIWNVLSGSPIAKLVGHREAVVSVAIDRLGQTIVTASEDATARLWDAETGAELSVLRGHGGPVIKAEFDSLGELLVTVSDDGTARLWDAHTGAEIGVLGGHEAPIRAAVFSPNGSLLATASDDRTSRLWTPASAASAITLRHGEPVVFAEFDRASERVVTASIDGVGRIWDASNGALIVELRGHGAQLRHAEFSPDDKYVVTSSEDQTARLWDSRSGAQLAVLAGHTGLLPWATFSEDGQRVLTTSRDGTARLWAVPEGDEIAVLTGHETGLTRASFGPGGRAGTGGTNGTARLWDVATGQNTETLVASPDAPVVAIAFSPDGKRVFTCSLDGTGILWDVARVTPISQHQFAVPCHEAEFDRDGGQILVAAGIKGVDASLLGGVTGQMSAALSGHIAPVRSVDISPAGDRAVSGDDAGGVRVWDTQSHVSIAVFDAHTSYVWSSRFSPDGRKIVTASGDGTAKIFAVFPSTAELVNHARTLALRELTACQREEFFLARAAPNSCER